jgi:hypothetical protein
MEESITGLNHANVFSPVRHFIEKAAVNRPDESTEEGLCFV